MRLSIITINYNNVNGLRRTIESVLSQSWTDFEWIIIDGGSTDGSRELIEACASHVAYWCSERDNGIYNAMNKGVSKAKGEYLSFLNSGDTYCGAETLSKVFEGPHKADVVYGNTKIRNLDGEIIACWSSPARISIVGYWNRMYLGHQSSFIKRNTLIAHPYNETFRISGDTEFFAHLVSIGGTFEKIDVPVSIFQLGGISNRLERARQKEENRALTVGMEHLFPKWLGVLHRLIPNIPIRLKWELIRFLCIIAAKKPADLSRCY